MPTLLKKNKTGISNFTAVHDIDNIPQLINDALEFKKEPFKYHQSGKRKTLGLIFMNPSLRTRLSTQKAALNLGMNVMVMNMDKEGWALEMDENAIMNGTTIENIKEAASVMGGYCDIIGIRSFPSLTDREKDYSEDVLNKFIKYAKVPVISLESATRHPLQSLADAITITELTKKEKPKVVLTWAPHVKALPQAVSNSFAEWMLKMNVDFTITHPKGYDLCKDFTMGATITNNQGEALKNADFIYVKNWSAYNDYGKILSADNNWMLTNEKLKITDNAKVMHCLPVRRGVELSHEILDGKNLLVLEQAANRVWAAQAVLKRVLDGII